MLLQQARTSLPRLYVQSTVDATRNLRGSGRPAQAAANAPAFPRGRKKIPGENFRLAGVFQVRRHQKRKTAAGAWLKAR
jgi:hypothetical protein